MTFRHFQIFLQVCDEGGMTKAAGKLHISQPSVSQAIKELEEHYGLRLFERLGKQLYLTAAGKELVHYARHAVRLTREAESALRSLSGASPLRVGATLTIGESIFVSLLCRFREKLPNQTVFSCIYNTAALEHALLRDELDLALVEGSIESEYLTERPFMEDELIFVAARGERKAMTEKDLGRCGFITREAGSGTRNLFEQTLVSHGIRPRIVGVYNNSASIKQAVVQGFGLTALSRRVLEPELTEGKLQEVRVPGIHFRRNFRLVHHCNKFITPAMEAFMELCHSFSRRREAVSRK